MRGSMDEGKTATPQPCWDVVVMGASRGSTKIPLKGDSWVPLATNGALRLGQRIQKKKKTWVEVCKVEITALCLEGREKLMETSVFKDRFAPLFQPWCDFLPPPVLLYDIQQSKPGAGTRLLLNYLDNSMPFGKTEQTGACVALLFPWVWLG